MNKTFDVLSRELFNLKAIVLILAFAFCYVSLTIFILNYRLIADSIFGNFSFIFKIKIILLSLLGLFSAFSFIDSALLILTGLLVGINIVLLISTFKFLKRGSGVKFFVGGGSIFGVISAGCTSCGFSALSVLGLGGGIGFASFGGGIIFYILSFGTLIFSIFYMSKKLILANECGVN